MENVAVPVNYSAIIIAAVGSMILGMLWYGPLFGKLWAKEAGITKDQIGKAKKKGMMPQYGLMFIGSLCMAWVLSHAIVFSGSYMRIVGMPAGLMTGFFNWFGFVAPVTVSSVLFEGKSWKLWCVNNGYYLVSLLGMGMLLAVWL